jgi:NAD(P)-dependent dehydrogenase (short-subunit alcohol dehydrogenase family)
MRISGRLAVVTGASSGIGRAVALHLARAGADVALVARREAALEAVAVDVRQLGRRALVVVCDVTDAAAVDQAFQMIGEQFGAPDILVNAAGFGVWKPFMDVSVAEHRGMMEVMYWGAFHWIRALLPEMMRQQRGHVVNLSAGSGRFALPVTSGYSAAAFAIAGLSEALHRELLGTPVGVSCVHPGSVRTEFWSEENTPASMIPPLVRYAPKLSADAVARNVCYCIRFGFPTRTLPIFVAFLARVNAVWMRLGDLVLWKWFVPLLLLLLVLRVLFR